MKQNLELTNALNLAKVEHGDRLDLSVIDEIDPAILSYYGTGIRIMTEDMYGTRRTGILALSTGVRPVVLLKHRRADTASTDALSHTDRLRAVQHIDGRYYTPTGERVYTNPTR